MFLIPILGSAHVKFEVWTGPKIYTTGFVKHDAALNCPSISFAEKVSDKQLQRTFPKLIAVNKLRVFTLVVYHLQGETIFRCKYKII